MIQKSKNVQFSSEQEQGFARTEVLSAGSPAGKLVARICEETPGIDYKTARQLAEQQLWKAAGRKRYSLTTPRQDSERADKLASRVDAVLGIAFTTHSTKDSGL